MIKRGNTMTINKKSPGFTLVEIMIVVAIIGLLAAIAVPNFIKARDNARKNTCINNLRLISAAKDQYVIDNNKASTIVPIGADLDTYLKGNYTDLACPSNGAYAILAGNVDPTCKTGTTVTDDGSGKHEL
jgi:prepilin-type N-terminal cleavage/methylation domain-containing protein